MPIHPHPQGPLAVELIEPAFDKLPGELDIQSSHDSGWLTISYRNETIARYLPAHQIAELYVHLLVDKDRGSDSEPNEVTESIMTVLLPLKEHGLEICHEYAESLGAGRYHHTLVLRNCPVTEKQVLELVQAVLDASRYAIDVTSDRDPVEKPSD